MKKKANKFVPFLRVFSMAAATTFLIALLFSWMFIGFLIHITSNDFENYYHRWLILFWGIALVAFYGWRASRFFGNILFQPIQKLNHAAHEIANGCFNVHIEDTTNIAEIHEITSNFNLMAQELQNMELIHNDFIRNVSHEFKTPLSAIKGYAIMLQKDTLSDADRLNYAQQISNSAERLSTLSNNILLLAKAENQQIQRSAKPFNLAEQLRSALLIFESQWTQKELTIDVDVPDIMDYCGNEELLFQVWQNLISNAIKFTGIGGQLSIHAIESANSITVSIQDNGIGIAQEDQKRIFEKFYQVDPSRSVNGNGLGLSLVQQIISCHNGTIVLNSQPGQGSTFTVTLPKQKEVLN